MDTRALLEGALLACVNVVMTLIGFMFPLLGNILLLLTPLPFIVLAVRWNSQLSILASVASAGLLTLLMGPEIILYTLFFSGLVGVSLGAAFEENFSPPVVLLVGAGAVLVSFLLNLTVSSYILEIDLVGQLETSLQTAGELYQQLGVSKEATDQVINTLGNIIKSTYLVLFLCSGLIVSSIEYYASVKLLTRLEEFDYPTLSFLLEFKLPRVTVIIYLVSFFFGGAIWKNINVLLTFLLIVEGGLVVYYYYLQGQINKFLLLVGILFLAVLLQVFLFIGIADAWFDFRKLESSSEQQ